MKPIDRPCPACGVQPGERCRSGKGKITDFHHARLSGVATRRNQLRGKP